MRIKFLAGVLFDRESRKSIPNETAPSTQESPKEVAATISAEELVEESDRYWRLVGRTLTLGGGIAVVGLLGISAMSFFSRVDAERSPNTAVTMVLERAPMGLILAVFGILATVAIALQVAVRVHPAAPSPDSRELARQQALTNVAALLVPAALGLGIYAAAHAFVGFETLDLVRMFGPLGIGMLIAVVAADAGAAVRPEFKSEEMKSLDRQREIANLELANALVLGGGHGHSSSEDPLPRPSRSALLARAAALVALPLLAALTVWLFARPVRVMDGGDFAVIVICMQVVSYVLAIGAYYAAVRRQWGSLAAVVVVGAIADVAFTLVIMRLALRIGAQAESYGVVALVASCLVGLSFLPWLLVFISIKGFPSTKRLGVIPHLVSKHLSRQLDKLRESASARPQKRGVNVFAVAAILSIWFPPAAIPLGSIALTQIRAASSAEQLPNEEPERGQGLAWCAILGSIVLAIVVLLALGGLAIMDWNLAFGQSSA